MRLSLDCFSKDGRIRVAAWSLWLLRPHGHLWVFFGTCYFFWHGHQWVFLNGHLWFFSRYLLFWFFDMNIGHLWFFWHGCLWVWIVTGSWYWFWFLMAISYLSLISMSISMNLKMPGIFQWISKICDIALHKSPKNEIYWCE